MQKLLTRSARRTVLLALAVAVTTVLPLGSRAFGQESPDSKATGPVPALMEAAVQGDVSKVARLLRAGADVNARRRGTAHTALMAAASYGEVEVVRLLLAAGADPALRDVEGRTALMRARENEHAEVAALLQAAMTKRRVASAPRAVANAAPAPEPTPAAGGDGPPVGRYTCHYTRYMQVVPAGNLITVLGPGRYQYLNRGTGSFRYDAGTTTLTWLSGPYAGSGVVGSFYHRESDDRPVVKLVLPNAGTDAQGRSTSQTNYCVGPAR